MEARGELPPRLYVSGVRRIGDNPIGGGGFADIWQGRTNGKADIVALKVLRIFNHGGEDQAVLQV